MLVHKLLYAPASQNSPLNLQLNIITKLIFPKQAASAFLEYISLCGSIEREASTMKGYTVI